MGKMMKEGSDVTVATVDGYRGDCQDANKLASANEGRSSGNVQ
jgi:hypothetical protein